MKRWIVTALVILALLALGCAGPAAAPQEAPIVTAPAATSAPTPTPTPEPTPVRAVAGYSFNEPAEFMLDTGDLRMKAPDGSYISMLPGKSDVDIASRSETAYIESLAESYDKEGDVEIVMEEYEPMEIDGSPGIHAVYLLRVPGGDSRHVLERIVQVGDTVYQLRFTDLTGTDRWMETFRKSGDTINVMWEDEADARDRSRLVLYDSGNIAICLPKGMITDDKAAATAGVTLFRYADEYMMSALRESFSDYASAGMEVDGFSLEDYAALVEDANDMTVLFAPDGYGNLATTYTNTVDGGEFFYYTTVRKGSDAFWVVNLACAGEQQETYLPQFELWANSIQLK